MCPQKRQEKEGSLPGRGGSESQIKSSRKKKKKPLLPQSRATQNTVSTGRNQKKRKKKQQQRQLLLTVFFFSPSNFYPQSYFSSNFCPQSCSYSRLFPVPFSRETQERARDTSARALAARDSQTERLFCRQTIPSTCSDLQFAIFALRNDSFFRALCKWTSN